MRIKKVSATVFIGLLAFSLNSFAIGQSKRISDFLPNISEVQRTVVVLTPPELTTRAPLTERQLLDGGCNFSSDDVAKNSDLINLVKDNLKDVQGEAEKFYLRNGIYFQLRNGAVVRYLFGGAGNRHSEIYGSVDNGGSENYVLFFAQGRLLINLQKWSKDNSVRKRNGDFCLGDK